MTQHVHTADKTTVKPFSGPVAKLWRFRRPSADGNTTEVEECACGATRRTNVNGRHVELGPWVDAPMTYVGSPSRDEHYLVTYRQSDATLVTAHHATLENGEARIMPGYFPSPAHMMPEGALQVLIDAGYRIQSA